MTKVAAASLPPAAMQKEAQAFQPVQRNPHRLESLCSLLALQQGLALYK